MRDKTAEFEQKIGYTFKDRTLIETALTHSSYANEHAGAGVCHNERMEFLGDAVLELVTSDLLYTEYPDMPEGRMTVFRAGLVCEPTLAMDAKDLRLGEYLRLGVGEEQTGGRERDSVTSDALEAVIGAIYLDGGIDAAAAFIRRFILNDIEKKKLFIDSKTRLQEAVDARAGGFVLSYEVTKESGPDHNKRYEVAALLNGRTVGKGSGRTKKAAEQEAAYQALKTPEFSGNV